MKKVALVLAFGALTAACGSNNTRTDGGTTTTGDSGGIVIPDTGVVRDTGPRTDAAATATCGTYAGVDETTISAVPDTCVPRCANATIGTAFEDCTGVDAGAGESCFWNALDADTTASANMSLGGSDFELNCLYCVYLNQWHCYSQICPAESYAAFLCDPDSDTDMCDGEYAALDECMAPAFDDETSTEYMTFDSCFQTSVGGCFDDGSGFAAAADGASVRMGRGLQRFEEYRSARDAIRSAH